MLSKPLDADILEALVQSDINLNQVDKFGYNILSKYLYGNWLGKKVDPDIIAILVKSGVDVNAENNLDYNHTPLWYAVSLVGNYPGSLDVSILKLLVENGANAKVIDTVNIIFDSMGIIY